MLVIWEEINKVLTPLKDYEDLCSRFQKAFSYSFVRENFNLSITELVGYTERLLGGDSRGRYSEYNRILVEILDELRRAGINNIKSLFNQVDTREKLAKFAEQKEISAQDVVQVLKYLVYWFIPMEKYLSGLVRDDPDISSAIKALRSCGIRTNLDLLQVGITSAGREELTASSGLPETVILDLVNRADFSRMPWASKATISNIIGAGYCSMDELANADPKKLYDDFFRYGDVIGKNLKLGNEIENSHRIAKIVPVLLQKD